MNIEKITSPFTLVIFGASGELARLMLFPAVYALAAQGRFPEDFHIVGFARSMGDDEAFREAFRQSVRKKEGEAVDEAVLSRLCERVHAFRGDYSSADDFRSLRTRLSQLHGGREHAVVAYFSVPPTAFQPIIANLASSRTRPDDDIRLVLEKPFGTGTKSAEDLIYFTLNHFREEQLFLLDHYLGKSAVRSLVNMRRHNRILDLLIEGRHIDNIQISALERDGVAVERAGYYDQVGTIKDFVQSHLLQLVALAAMHLPVSDSATSFQREKNAILSALCYDPRPGNLVIGQYQGYRDSDPRMTSSDTDTYAAIKLGIDREDWYRVPVYLRTGKALQEKHTSIVVEFKKLAFQSENDPPNRLVIELYPREQVSMILYDNRGGAVGSDVALTDSLACEGDDCLPPHALFLLDTFLGRRTYFLSFPEVVASWRLTDRILSSIAPDNDAGVPLVSYPQGSQGPNEAMEMIERDGRKWFEG